MYKRLLVPVDGGHCSEHTVNWALALAKALGADVTFLHVLESPLRSMYTLPGGALYVTDLMPELRKARQALLERGQAKADALDVASETSLLEAEHPAGAILEQEATYDLTVMGTHSRRGVNRALLGSVTEGVIRQSAIPHLVVRCPKSLGEQQPEA